MSRAKDILDRSKEFVVTPDTQRIILALDMKRLKTPSGIDKTVVEQKGDRQGGCYELAGSFVIGMRGRSNKDWLLIHAFINPPLGPLQGTNYDHAWCEKGNIVYEPVFNNFYVKADYHKAYEPKNVKKYSEQDARQALIRYETWGPWE